MRAMARDMRRCIANDDHAPPRFARVGQNISTPAALLRTLPEPATPEAHRVQREMANLLTLAAE